MSTTVFLHIPKTAGQTIHAELSRVVGADQVSPVRVHTQATEGKGQFPPGYALYSGHLDWDALDSLPEDRFVFTVLRDPRERIASFYFYLLKEANALSEEELAKPHRTGMNRILSLSADEYFFGGDKSWRRFIRDHYDNVYCAYFATRKMRSWPQMRGLTPEQKVERALKNLPLIDAIYSTRDLAVLERDLGERLGQPTSVVGTYINTGGHDPEEERWPKLLDRMDSKKNMRRLRGFAEADETLLKALGMQV